MAIENFLTTLEQISNQYNSAVASQLGISIASFTFIVTLITIWTVIWKGLALWKSAKKKSLLWFIILLIVNDFGILEILYFFWISKINYSKKIKKKKK